jgi:hypothetical protein
MPIIKKVLFILEHKRAEMSALNLKRIRPKTPTDYGEPKLTNISKLN